MFPATAEVYLPGGDVPEVGDTMRNPDLADTDRLIARRGVQEFYRGSIARAIVDEARNPTTASGVEVFRGEIQPSDIAKVPSPGTASDPAAATAGSTSSA